MVSIYSISAYSSGYVQKTTSKEQSKSVKDADEKVSAEDKDTKKAENIGNDDRFETLYARLKALALRLGITVSKNEKISTILAKIQERIAQLEKEKSNSNINVIKSEYETIKQQYHSLINGDSSLLTGLDILSQSNRAELGI